MNHIEQFCDRYLIVEELAVGAFSRTLLARDLEMIGYPLCIIKCSTPDDPDQPGNAAALKRQVIRQEARILDRLKQSSANVPHLLAYPEHHHPPYMVGEYIEGDLIERLKQEPFSAAQIVSFLQNVLSVLDVIHRHNIVHQDIKPGNLIQRKNGTIAVIDFGAAIDLDEFTAETDAIYGTPGYSPPEQEDGKIGFHTDLYALGMSAIELLTATPPQQIERHPNGHLNWQHRLEDQSLDPKLRTILDRMVALHPTDRYQSAIDVLADLQKIKVDARISALQTQLGNSAIRVMLRNAWSQIHSLRPPRSVAAPVIVGISLICGFGFVPLLPRMTDTIAAQMGALQSHSSFDLTLTHDVTSSQPIEQFLIAAHSNQIVTLNRDRQVEVWDLTTAQRQHHWTTPNSIEMIAVDRDQVVSQLPTGTIQIQQLATGSLVRQIDSPEAASSASLSPNGQYLATVSASRTLRIWNLHTGALIRTVEAITAVHYAPNNTLLCATRDFRIDVWDAEYSQEQQALVGHTGEIREIAVSPDGEWLASTGEDGTLIWKLNTAELVQVIPPTSKVNTAAKNTSYLVTQHKDGALRLWNASGQMMKSLAYLNSKAAMSPDARQVVSVDVNHLKIWQLSEAKS